jgi:hypothetical protein
MSSPKKVGAFPSPAIEPELREFIDELIVPMLVQAGLRDIAEENRLASPARAVANSPRSANE